MNSESVVIAKKIGDRTLKVEFCLDPDGSGLQWFQITQEPVSSEGHKEIGTGRRQYSGQCFDTGEYHSHIGELVKELSEVAPSGTSLMIFECSGSCGTKTFDEEVTATYYE